MNLLVSIGNVKNVSSKIAEFFDGELKVISTSELGITGDIPKEIEESTVRLIQDKLTEDSESYKKVYFVVDLEDLQAFSLASLLGFYKDSESYVIGIVKSTSGLQFSEGCAFILNVLQEMRRSKLIDFLTVFSEQIIQKYDGEINLLNRDDRVADKITRSLVEMLYWDGQIAIKSLTPNSRPWDALRVYEDYDVQSELSTPTFQLEDMDYYSYHFIISQKDAQDSEFFKELEKTLDKITEQDYKLFIEETASTYCFRVGYLKNPVVFKSKE